MVKTHPESNISEQFPQLPLYVKKREAMSPGPNSLPCLRPISLKHEILFLLFFFSLIYFRERAKHEFIVPLICAFIGWFLYYVP